MEIPYEDGVIGTYLKKMRNYGYSDIALPISTEFKEEFPFVKKNMKNGVVRFESHKQLDIFLNQFDLQELKENFYGEYQLLKSFDEAFWVKINNGVKFESNNPLIIVERTTDCENRIIEARTCKCPFGNTVLNKKDSTPQAKPRRSMRYVQSISNQE